MSSFTPVVSPTGHINIQMTASRSQMLRQSPLQGKMKRLRWFQRQRTAFVILCNTAQLSAVVPLISNAAPTYGYQTRLANDLGVRVAKYFVAECPNQINLEINTNRPVQNRNQKKKMKPVLQPFSFINSFTPDYADKERTRLSPARATNREKQEHVYERVHLYSLPSSISFILCRSVLSSFFSAIYLLSPLLFSVIYSLRLFHDFS